MKKLLGLFALIAPLGLALTYHPNQIEVKASGTNFKQDIVFNWDGEEFSISNGGGVNIYRYNKDGQKEVATRLKLAADYSYSNMATPNIYDESSGVAQGFSYAKHNSSTRLSGPVYNINEEGYKYLANDPTSQSLTISYWVKNTNQEGKRWQDDVGTNTLCGNYEGIFSFRSKSIKEGELVGLDLGIGGIYYYSEKDETETEINNIPNHQFLTASTSKRTQTRTFETKNGNAEFMSKEWEMITYVFDSSSGFSIYKNDKKIANYANSTTLVRNKGNDFTVDQYRSLLATMLNREDSEFCIHRGFNRSTSYGQTYTNGIGIDDMNIFNRGLSETEVKEFFSSYGTLNYMDGASVKATYKDLIGNKCFTLKPNSNEHKSYGPILSKTVDGIKYNWYRWTSDEFLQDEVNVDDLMIANEPKNVYLDWQNSSNKVSDGGRNAAKTFIDANMHMNDYVTSQGWCADNEHHYYQTAKAAYNSMSEEGRFALQNDEEFIDAKARLDAWANANGDSLDSASNRYNTNEIEVFPLSNLNNGYANLAIATFVVASLSILFIFIYKKRKKSVEE